MKPPPARLFAERNGAAVALDGGVAAAHHADRLHRLRGARGDAGGAPSVSRLGVPERGIHADFLEVAAAELFQQEARSEMSQKAIPLGFLKCMGMWR